MNVAPFFQSGVKDFEYMSCWLIQWYSSAQEFLVLEHIAFFVRDCPKRMH
jgi:hypothetical protein